MTRSFPTYEEIPALADRFLQHVDRADGCWKWKAGHNNEGYGLFSFGTRRSVSAHRFAYQLFVGPIPDGLTIDHLCRNHGCCNPAHLEAVTMAENIRRGLRGRLVTACVHGHPYTPENTGRQQGGRRRCLTCARAGYREYNRKRRRAA